MKIRNLHWSWEIRDVSGLEKHFGICRKCKRQRDFKNLLVLIEFPFNFSLRMCIFKIVLNLSWHHACINLNVILRKWLSLASQIKSSYTYFHKNWMNIVFLLELQLLNCFWSLSFVLLAKIFKLVIGPSVFLLILNKHVYKDFQKWIRLGSNLENGKTPIFFCCHWSFYFASYFILKNLKRTKSWKIIQ